jgi:hypothetical protein
MHDGCYLAYHRDLGAAVMQCAQQGQWVKSMRVIGGGGSGYVIGVLV